MFEVQKRVAFEVLGCRLNAYEVDALATKFRNNGYAIVNPNQKPSCIVINTCTVTNQADRKSRNIISRSLRRMHNLGPETLVVVSGCFAETHKKELMEMDSQLYVVANRHKSQIFDIVDAYLAKELPRWEDYQINEESDQGLFDFITTDSIFHTRGMIKIQDGCNNFCSFCIIPYSRGSATSRAMPDILNDVRTMVEKYNFKEIVLTGVNMSYYTWETKVFSDLLEQILNLDLDFRLRLSSLEPHLLDEKFFSLIDHPKLCQHLHLCIQSGSSTILKAMKRLYCYEDYRNIILKIRTKRPTFNITTDLIVGFPGESDVEFNESLHAIEELNLGQVHTFRYSKRTGTEAAVMPNQVGEFVKIQRSEKVRKLADKVQKKYQAQFIGQKVEVIVEEVFERVLKGTTREFIPICINVDGDISKINRGHLLHVNVDKVGLDNDKNCLVANI